MFLFWFEFLVHFNKVTKRPVSVVPHRLQSSYTKTEEYKSYVHSFHAQLHMPPNSRLNHCAVTTAP